MSVFQSLPKIYSMGTAFVVFVIHIRTNQVYCNGKNVGKSLYFQGNTQESEQAVFDVFLSKFFVAISSANETHFFKRFL